MPVIQPLFARLRPQRVVGHVPRNDGYCGTNATVRSSANTMAHWQHVAQPISVRS